MMRGYRLECLAALAIVAFCAMFLFTSTAMKGAAFSGSDEAGSSLVAELSGKPVAAFTPVIPQWQPPGAEIESCLFALQAAAGGILVGGVFGYWIGKKSA
jgi:cobalt/nickel transport protein